MVMSREQKLYSELVYRINAALPDVTYKLLKKSYMKGSTVTPSVYDPYSRKFHWLSVHDDRWAFQDPKPDPKMGKDRFEQIRENVRNKIQAKKSEWEHFQQEYKEAGHWESVRDSFDVLGGRSSDPEEFHFALLRLHQLYPIDSEKYIDGIVWRNVKRRVKENRKNPRIDFAEGRLLFHQFLTYIDSPWAEMGFYHYKEKGKEKKVSCQENFPLWHPGEPDVGSESEIPAIRSEITKRYNEGAFQLNPFYSNYIMLYFQGHKGRGRALEYLKDFVELKIAGVRKSPHIAIFPLYDAKIEGSYYGNLLCNLQIAFRKKSNLIKMRQDRDKILRNPYTVIEEIKHAAVHEILKQPMRRSADFFEHFIMFLPFLQDWERAMIFEKTIPLPLYCYRREDGTWRACSHRKRHSCNKQCWNEVSKISRIATEDRHFEDNETGRRFQLVDLGKLLVERFVPNLPDVDYGRYSNRILVLEYPSHTLLPEDEGRSMALWLHYKREQLELLRQLALHRKLKVETTKHGSRAAFTGIMARNLSHNIGSHVISYWSTREYNTIARKIEEIDVAADIAAEAAETLEEEDLGAEAVSEKINGLYDSLNDIKERLEHVQGFCHHSKELLQYLQLRMDFLAEVTTSTPSSEINMDFKNEVLDALAGISPDADGLTPILKYIAHSEGLNIIDRFTFSIHRNINPRVSIPNGVIGVQAFNAILENFIRNSSKHHKHPGKSSSKRYKNLFKIELREPENEKWREAYMEVRLWDRRRDSCTKSIAEKLLRFIDPSSKKGEFVDSAGALKPEAWGFKEMRICANFLRKRSADCLVDPMEKGKPPLLGIYRGGGPLLHKVGDAGELMDRSEDAPRRIDAKKTRLGLCFFLMKPKDMLIETHEVKRMKHDKFHIDGAGEIIGEGETVIPHRMLAVKKSTDALQNDPRLPCRVVEIGADENVFNDSFYLRKYREYIHELNHGVEFPFLVFTGGGKHREYDKTLFTGDSTRMYGAGIDAEGGLDAEVEKHKACAIFYYHADGADIGNREGLERLTNKTNVIAFHPLSSRYSIDSKLRKPPGDETIKEQFLLELIESIITEVIIVDERVAEFAENDWAHGLKIRDVFNLMKIYITPIEKETVSCERLADEMKKNPENRWLIIGKSAPPGEKAFLFQRRRNA